MNLTELSKVVHAANAKWWQNIETGEPIKRNKGELLALIHSEISECFVGERDGLMDDKLPHRKMGEVEVVDAMIRAFDYAAGFGHDLSAADELLSISEFESLRTLAFHCHPSVFDPAVDAVAKSGIAALHAQVSVILEHERKGRPAEACVELVRLIICLALYGSRQGYDLQGAYDEKMAFNAKREDHTHEARRIAGGKQF